MVTKKVYQEVESKLMMLESENQRLKFALSNAKNKLNEVVKELEIAQI